MTLSPPLATNGISEDHAISIGQHVEGLTPGEETAFDIQRSSKFWKEPKELLLTILACCLASMVQGENIEPAIAQRHRVKVENNTYSCLSRLGSSSEW